MKEEEILEPCLFASNKNQLNSLAEKYKEHKLKKYSLYEDITLDNLTNYHLISCRPITKKAEDDMELVSDIITWGELYLNNWNKGIYKCSRCNHKLYSSDDKWKGPCVWPSFRNPIDNESISTTIVYPYNNYKVIVKEVYCNKCNLFIGHQFEDGKEKGDDHQNARWRH
jgi:peptide-methionine (R)-S-oxide reductase